MSISADEILAKLQASFPGLVKSGTCVGAVTKASGPQTAGAQAKEYPTWTVPERSVRAVFERLHSRFSFDYLDVVTAVDWSGPVSPKGYPQPGSPAAAAASAPAATAKDIFEVVYIVTALATGMKLCLRCEIPRKEPSIHSLYGIYLAADWQEREVYDLFGIHFEGHPNLRRILTPDGQAGHPLRKDYEHVPDVYD